MHNGGEIEMKAHKRKGKTHNFNLARASHKHIKDIFPKHNNNTFESIKEIIEILPQSCVHR